jgi:hypothetical protein
MSTPRCLSLGVDGGDELGDEGSPPVAEGGSEGNVLIWIPTLERERDGVGQCWGVQGDDLEAGIGHR